jgi:heat shock protein HtpX
VISASSPTTDTSTTTITLRALGRVTEGIRATRDHRGVHEDLIRSARRRIRVVAVIGFAILVLTMAAIVFPVAWVLGATSNPLGTDLGYGWGLVTWSASVSVALGCVVAGATFAWALLHVEGRVLDFVRAWPGPTAGPKPPPRLPDDAVERAEKLLTGLGLAAGVHAPRIAVVIDDAPNCLTIGRRPQSAWIVVTTGLLDTLSRVELEAVLAYEIGRVTELDVSLDTVVYACTARVFELWGGVFDDFDEATLLMAPLAVLAAPVVVGGMLLRAAALRSRARLSDGLAVRYCRNPVALAHALRRIYEDPHDVRRGDPGNAHLWLEYPHTRASRWLLRTHRILPKRVNRIEQVARIPH